MGAFTYPRSEPGSAGHMDLVERMNSNTLTLLSLVEDLSDEKLTHQAKDGEWSIKEVFGHLCDYAQSLHERLFRMINLEQPYLEAWDQEERLRDRNPQEALMGDLRAEISKQRGDTVEMLADLVHWNWARTGRHAERGRVSIRQMVDAALLHEESHLEQIRGMAAELSSVGADL